MAKPQITIWLLAFLLRCCFGIEEFEHCQHGECMEENNVGFFSQYMHHFDIMKRYTSDRVVDDNYINTDFEAPIAANEDDTNVASSFPESQTMFINARSEELRSVYSRSKESLGNGNAADTDDEATAMYEFPPVKRLPTGFVGEVTELRLQPGKAHKRITRATDPPIFEIPDFLSHEECDLVVQKSKDSNMKNSELFGSMESQDKRNSSDYTRISESAWLSEAILGTEFWISLHERYEQASKPLQRGPFGASTPIWPRVAEMRKQPTSESESLTGKSLFSGDLFKAAESKITYEVVSYGPAGHYHCHIDSSDDPKLPCCFYTNCDTNEHTVDWAKCCRLCRFMTVMYYLNDVIQGGETAFPLADMPEDLFEEKLSDPQKSWRNLSHFCHNSSVVVTPKKGTAIAWYTHFPDDKGYLGPVDLRSYHGGCDIIRGEKWIATSWISEPTYEHRFAKSNFFGGK